MFYCEQKFIQSWWKESGPSLSIWVTCGRTLIKDWTREGGSETANTEENIEKVHNVVLDDRRLKAYEIAKAEDNSEERVRHIF